MTCDLCETHRCDAGPIVAAGSMRVHADCLFVSLRPPNHDLVELAAAYTPD